MTENSVNSVLPLVVGYDGSPDSDLALQWAAENRRTPDQPITVVLVADPEDPLLAENRDILERSAVEWEAQANQRIEELGIENVNVELRRGGPVAELLRASRHAEMLVLGSRGHGLVAGSVMGSVSQHVTRHADVPAVVVRKQHSPQSRRIIVGVDGSPESSKALEFALERASRTGESVIAVHGYRIYGSSRTVFELGVTADTLERMETAEQFLDETVVKHAEQHPEVTLETQAIPQPGARVLVDCSHSASLLVLGSRGLGAFTGLLLGSVSQHVLGHGECPVVVIR